MIDGMLRRLARHRAPADGVVASPPQEPVWDPAVSSNESDEVPRKAGAPPEAPPEAPANWAANPDHDNHHYRAPIDLTVTPTILRRVLVIGSCLAGGLPDYIQSAASGCETDYVLFNNLSELPTAPPQDADAYDFQVIQIAIRSVLPDYTYFRAPYDDPRAWEQVFEQAKLQVGMLLEAAMRWNTAYGLLTFVTNFLVPQQNAHGRLLPRYDLRNPVHLVERLNQHLYEEVKRFENAHVVDMDEVASTFGRKYVQDDGVWQTNHGAVLSDADFDRDQLRIAAIPAISAHYTLRTYDFVQALWAEIIALYRIVRQSDAVKLVIVDLDDTLWRGIAAEIDDYPADGIEGWPLGLVEALGFLKRRGIVLAIVSKNEEKFVTSVWNEIFQGRLMIEDFAVRKINWEPKTQNVQAIIDEVNVLPRSVVFIDDNPVERASVKAGIPDIRLLGANQYYLRRILLWSSETQVPLITDESARRTEMIQANSARQTELTRLSRPEFLATLGLHLHVIAIGDSQHKSFPRAFELLNKTNQFNTTGKRWSHEECLAALSSGIQLYAFQVEDRFSKYGLVGVLVVRAGMIEQMVMSCRVVGLDVEVAAVADTCRRMREAGAGTLGARLRQTGSNLLCQNLFERCGFVPDGEVWVLAGEAAVVPVPAHIVLS